MNEVYKKFRTMKENKTPKANVCPDCHQAEFRMVEEKRDFNTIITTRIYHCENCGYSDERRYYFVEEAEYIIA